MTPQDIANALTEFFGEAAIAIAPGSWQVESSDFRLLVLLSEDQSWLRMLIPIAPLQDAQPFLEQLLEANFDQTQETRYAMQQGVLWGVFQHSREGLNQTDFSAAINRLLILRRQGLDPSFNQLVENRIRLIIRAAKQQGQSLDLTLQTLDRFYQEGVMGDLAGTTQSREETMAAWKRQLERLWNEETI